MMHFRSRGDSHNNNNNLLLAVVVSLDNPDGNLTTLATAKKAKSLLNIASQRRSLLLLLPALLGAWILARNDLLLVRKGYVKLHYWIAPWLALLFSSSPSSIRDLSEGGLYRHLPSSVALPTRGGCVWDVGANNGVWHSNSHYLIHARNFSAWLFEPDAATFLQLRDYYYRKGDRTTNVKLHNFALAETAGVQSLRLFPMGFENTIVAGKHNQADAMEYTYEIAVQSAALLCSQQREAISSGLCNVTSPAPSSNGRNRTTAPNKQTATQEPFDTFTVLSVDAEGADWEVFTTAHNQGCRWDLVILEGEGDAAKTKAMGYEMVMHLAYNYVYAYRGEETIAANSLNPPLAIS